MSSERRTLFHVFETRAQRPRPRMLEIPRTSAGLFDDDVASRENVSSVGGNTATYTSGTVERICTGRLNGWDTGGVTGNRMGTRLRECDLHEDQYFHGLLLWKRLLAFMDVTSAPFTRVIVQTSGHFSFSRASLPNRPRSI